MGTGVSTSLSGWFVPLLCECVQIRSYANVKFKSKFVFSPHERRLYLTTTLWGAPCSDQPIHNPCECVHKLCVTTLTHFRFIGEFYLSRYSTMINSFVNIWVMVKVTQCVFSPAKKHEATRRRRFKFAFHWSKFAIHFSRSQVVVLHICRCIRSKRHLPLETAEYFIYYFK